MKKIKLTEISDEKSHSRSLLQLENFLKTQNYDPEISVIGTDKIEELTENNYLKMKEYDFIKLSLESSAKILDKWAAQPAQVRWIGCCDVFIKEDSNLWPRVALFDCIRESIVSHIKDHDIKEAGYVISNDYRGRVLVSVLLNLGHRQVYLVGENEEFIQSEVEFLRRFHIGTEILSLPSHQLTLQTTRSSILINAAKLEEGSSTLNDLAYFNFMKENGVVLDLDFETSKNSLLEEAQKASLKVIAKDHLAAYYDFSLIKKLVPGMQYSFEDFFKNWQQLQNSTKA